MLQDVQTAQADSLSLHGVVKHVLKKARIESVKNVLYYAGKMSLIHLKFIVKTKFLAHWIINASICYFSFESGEESLFLK